MPGDSLVVELEGVSFAYERVAVLSDIDLRVTPGRFLGLVGPSGAGKSTLLKLLGGALEPTIGVAKRSPGAADWLRSTSRDGQLVLPDHCR